MTLLHRNAVVAGAPPAVLAAAAPATFAQRAAGVSRAAVLLAVTAAALSTLAAPGWLPAHQTRFLAAGFLLGLPHGAVDHLIPLRHRWLRGGPVSLLVVLVGYAALAALAFAGLRLAGPVVLPVLLVVSMLHFGSADLSPANNAAGNPARGWRASTASGAPAPASPRTPTTWMLGALARGGPVVAGPLLCWPGPTGAALTAVGLDAAPSTTTSAAVAVALLLVSATYALRAVRQRRLMDAAEVALLVALFTVAPPLAAFGVYFGLWHGLRHTARLLADDPANTADLNVGRLGRPLGRFLTAAALPTAVALATVVVLVHLTVGHADLVGPVFAALLALTVPHVVVVGWWDADEQRTAHHSTALSATGEPS